MHLIALGFMHLIVLAFMHLITLRFMYLIAFGLMHWHLCDFQNQVVCVQPIATSLEPLVDAELLFKGGTSIGLQKDVRGSLMAAAEETLITLGPRLNVNGHVSSQFSVKYQISQMNVHTVFTLRNTVQIWS